MDELITAFGKIDDIINSFRGLSQIIKIAEPFKFVGGHAGSSREFLTGHQPNWKVSLIIFLGDFMGLTVIPFVYPKRVLWVGTEDAVNFAEILYEKIQSYIMVHSKRMGNRYRNDIAKIFINSLK